MTTENVISFVNSKIATLGKEVVSASFVMGKNLIDNTIIGFINP